MSTASAATSNTIGSSYIAELEHEGRVARQVLERVPEDKFDWKPHEKSMTFSRLASHIAEMISWTGPTLQFPELDFSKMDYKPFEPSSNAELLEYFDKNLAEAIDVLRNTSDEQFM